MSKFTDILKVSPLADGKTWVTRKEFGYDIGEEGSDNSIKVPIGFITEKARQKQGGVCKLKEPKRCKAS